MLYITFNDAPSGIYFSQVTDVCKYLRDELHTPDINLIAFISIRSFSSNRSQIKAAFPKAIVIPLVPKMKFWKANWCTMFFLALIFRQNRIIARGPYATWLALSMKRMGLFKYVIFDARGAYYAELNEYNVIENEGVKSGIRNLETSLLIKADFRLAVSQKLVNYWEREYGYSSEAHVVIPCTLGSEFNKKMLDSEKRLLVKSKLGFKPDDLLMVYSGSSAGWQSFHLVNDFLNNALGMNVHLKVLFLSKELPAGMDVFRDFPGRIVQKWVSPALVRELLCACDYGLIIREDSVTNEVASPVKFAEYLSCGLRILISNHIGDFTEFVRNNNCGQVIGDVMTPIVLKPVSPGEKEELNALALKYFAKSSCKLSYQKLVA